MKGKNVNLSGLKVCRSYFSKARGLMFSKKKNLIFIFSKEQKISLHNIFVFFCIDLIFLDKDLNVVEIKRKFKPFRFYTSRKKAKYVIEIGLKNNEDIKKYNDICVGDKVTFR